MGMPKKLFLFDLYIDGQTYLGQVEEVTPPKLSLKAEDYQGADMVGSVAVTMGFDSGALSFCIILPITQTTMSIAHDIELYNE
ncbi:phage major tail tube protein [Providencia rettgeri]|uniref:phage major tail tube protein n=1 Tax=Providencia rettgeri TaxID=587 RepID=UPI00204C4744|nr:phage major tail tube protein [Providencia rettgeri]